MLDHCYLIPGSISVTASSGYCVLTRILPRGEKLGKKVKYNFFFLFSSLPLQLLVQIRLQMNLYKGLVVSHLLIISLKKPK